MHRSVSVAAAAVPAAMPAAAVAVSVTLAGPVVHCLYDDAFAAVAAAVWLVMAAFAMWASGGTVCHRPDPVWSWVVAVGGPHPAVD